MPAPAEIPTRTIDEFMSKRPQVIGPQQPLSAAHALMREHSVRHLPVVDGGGQLVGVVSQDDLHLMETLKDVDPECVLVEEAMTPNPFVVSPRTPVQDVARAMIEHRYGSALVVDRGLVVGMFTKTDALRVLSNAN